MPGCLGQAWNGGVCRSSNSAPAPLQAGHQGAVTRPQGCPLTSLTTLSSSLPQSDWLRGGKDSSLLDPMW